MQNNTIIIVSDRKKDYNQIKAFLEGPFIVIQRTEISEFIEEVKTIADDVRLVIVDHRFSRTLQEKMRQALNSTLHQYNIPILAIIGRYEPEEGAKAIEEGANDVLLRPYEKTVLLQRINNTIAQNQWKTRFQYDALTGVYNKDSYYQKVRELIKQNPDGDYTIVCLDVEQFKLINDLFGTAEGDRLLEFIGNCLASGTEHTGGSAGRIGADIFSCCYPNVTEKYQLIADGLCNMLKDYPLNMEIIPAIGFYHVTDTSLSVNRMCDRAILATNSVKGHYLQQVAVYDDDLRTDLIIKQEIVNDMEGALQNEEFKVYFQPKCDMDTGRIVGAEALTRWIHPQKGMISPDVFIPIFEENQFILKLDSFIWEKTCKIIREWIDEGHDPLPISVNVSRVNLFNDTLYEQLVGLIEKYQLEPQLLELEITESAYNSNDQYLIKIVNRLRQYGFTVLMDDFGSGYSSLNMLKDISVDILKTDMRFLTGDADGKDKGGEILQSVVRMAHWLNLMVIAEGVETKEQVDFLLSINCHYAQGYYYYKPMPWSEFKKLLLEKEKTDFQGMRHKFGETFNIHELLHSDVMSNALLQNILGGIAVYEYEDGNLKLVRVNRRYYAETQCEEEEVKIYAQNIFDTIYEEDREVFNEMIAEAARNQDDGAEGVFRRKRDNKNPVWLRARFFFLRENEGKKIFYSSIRNITEEKEAEERLRISEECFRIAMSATTNLLFVYNVRERKVDYSEENAKRLGMEKHIENVPESLIDAGIIYPSSHKALRELFEKISKGEPKATGEMKVQIGGSEYRWVRVTMTTIYDKAGNPEQAVGVIENIDQIKKLEDRLNAENKSS